MCQELRTSLKRHLGPCLLHAGIPDFYQHLIGAPGGDAHRIPESPDWKETYGKEVQLADAWIKHLKDNSESNAVLVE
jgi:hypothetical protein